ncbi:unnamed protein product [Toxocara canis]|uniref:Tudor-knot domain-containing protein n=1 Tax=Toxocara canis TaxID=6265 RepID=A0A183U6D1_TOXCA|nr:unnamed protein product [Toxocara canis]
MVQENDVELKQGDVCLVHRRAGAALRRATIVEIRLMDDGLNNEYYVHYDGSDRRMDEWVSKTRIQLASVNQHHDVEDEVENKRKITRNQKRRYSEISTSSKTIAEVDALTAALEKEHEEVSCFIIQ